MHSAAASLGEKVVALRKNEMFDDRPGRASGTSALGKLAREYYLNGDWERATTYWRQSTLRMMRAYRDPHAAYALRPNPQTYAILNSERQARDEHARWSPHFVGLIGALYHTAPTDFGVLKEAFELAQWALDLNSGLPFAQMAARSTNARLSALQKERDDLVLKFHDREGMSYADQRPLEARITELNKLIESDCRAKHRVRRRSHSPLARFNQPCGKTRRRC